MTQPHAPGSHPEHLAEEVSNISVVVPVYQGAQTLEALVAELAPLTALGRTPAGRAFRVVEVILVNDGAVDGSTRVMQSLASTHPFLMPLWLSRNFGQHPATLAGIASTTGDWVVTLDEDGQHGPGDIPVLIDRAYETGAQLVYAKPANQAPHPLWRNLTSATAKLLSRVLVGRHLSGGFSSFRLIEGEIARGLAAYCGHGVYLDVALTWVAGETAFCPVSFRQERGRPSGYSFRRLLSHFWKLVLSAGTRPLRIIAILGSLSILAAIAISGYAIWAKLAHHVPIQGWTSLVTAVCLFSGLILFSLGVIAEYLAMTLTMAMGKPLYLIVSRRVRGKVQAP